jgi:hypothetical protein
MLDQYTPPSRTPTPPGRPLLGAGGCALFAMLGRLAGWGVAQVRYENTPQVGWRGTCRMAHLAEGMLLFGLAGLAGGATLYVRAARAINRRLAIPQERVARRRRGRTVGRSRAAGAPVPSPTGIRSPRRGS